MNCTGTLCGIDSETTLIENGYTWPEVVVAGFACNGHVDIVQWQYLEQYQKEFVKINPDTKFVFFNNAFDINVMGRDIWLEEMKKDNRIMELSVSYKIYLTGTEGWIPPRVTLYDVALRTLGVKLNKEDGTRTSFNRQTPLSMEQILYLVEDCVATELCGLKYNNMPTESIQARASFVLSEISHNGMLVDKEHLYALRTKMLMEMSELAQKLRSFGYKIKKDTDKMTQDARFDAICKAFGVPNVANRLQSLGLKSIPKPAFWILAANLLNKFSEPGVLFSDVREVVEGLAAVVLNADVNWSASNKNIKALVTEAQSYIRSVLAEIECDDCIPEKSPKAEVALVICEILIDKFLMGDTLQCATDSLQPFFDEFQMCYDENLGWLAGTKPETNAAFLQRHLNGLLQANPKLELPLTESSKDNIREYKRECKKRGIEEDAETMRKLYVYACSSSELWRFNDLGITDPFLAAYTQYKHLEKLLSTYVTDKYIEGDGRVHTRFSDWLITGRTSSGSPSKSFALIV
jgi:hypothetical protein